MASAGFDWYITSRMSMCVGAIMLLAMTAKRVDSMANLQHLELLRDGATAIRRWRRENPGKQLDLRGADIGSQRGRESLIGVDLSDADLAGANLQGVRLMEADLSRANFSGADLAGANLQGVHLMKADLSNANLSGAIVERAGMHGANLDGAKLVDAVLRSAHLSEASLRSSILDGADAMGASFEKADLTLASMAHANLSHVDFWKADLSKADLSGSDLREANLRRSALAETRFDGAKFGSTVLVEVDISSARGLETVEHLKRSLVGPDTVSCSRGLVLPAFLVGCGESGALLRYLERFPMHGGVPDLHDVRLGKIEKMILHYLFRYEKAVGRPEVSPAGYRSQIIMALYRSETGDSHHNYRTNMRKLIPPELYDCLQVRVTRSLASLERKLLIQRLTMVGGNRNTFRKRRWRFALTALGRQLNTNCTNTGSRGQEKS